MREITSNNKEAVSLHNASMARDFQVCARDSRMMANTIAKVTFGGFILSSSLVNLEAATKLSDVIEKASISGFAFTRVQTLHGSDGEGTRWQWRFKPTITTGEVAGWSASAGIFFSKGSSTPDDNNSHNDISGSRGDTQSSFVDRFNIGDFYITYNAKEALNSQTIIRAGQRSPGTPYNDNVLDRALGVFIENADVSFLNVGFQWWDTWMGDDMFISRRSGGSAAQATGIGNDLFMIYLKSGADFTKNTGLSYNLWYSYIVQWVDIMAFADIAYTAKLGNHSLGITGQVSFTRLKDNPTILSSGDFGFQNLYIPNNNYNYARNRGMYNVRIDYRYNFTQTSSDANEEAPPAPKAVGYFGLAAGYAGTFSNGFGTLIDNTGGLKLGGTLWNNFAPTEANGFGILGVGGFQDSSINVAYLKAEMGYKKANFALDFAYVDASHFYWLAKGANRFAGDLNQASNNANLYAENRIHAATFFEAGLTAGYKFTDSLSMTIWYAWDIGAHSMDVGRFRFLANYVF